MCEDMEHENMILKDKLANTLEQLDELRMLIKKMQRTLDSEFKLQR